MIRDFSKEELEAAETGHDTELTLGGGTLLVLAGSDFFVMCAVCFGLGYVVGHRSSSAQDAANGVVGCRLDHSASENAGGIMARNLRPLGRRRLQPRPRQRPQCSSGFRAEPSAACIEQLLLLPAKPRLTRSHRSSRRLIPRFVQHWPVKPAERNPLPRFRCSRR